MNDIDMNILKNIQCLICDVDGVLTTGALFYSDQGDAFKVFHAKDGLGLKMLTDVGFQLAVITGSKSQAIKTRLGPLGATYIYQGCDHKEKSYQDLKRKTGLTDHEFAYIGDDLPDIPVMKLVGFAVAPKNAVELTKHVAHYVTQANGGEGAVRELCELLCQSKPLEYQKILASYNIEAAACMDSL